MKVYVLVLLLGWGLPRLVLAVQFPCLIPPTFDSGIGELYFCSPAEGERHLIAYARRSYAEEGLREDIWANFRGVFANHLWINVGLREANDTAQPAWQALTALVERLRAIKAGDKAALRAFLTPIATMHPTTDADRALQQALLAALRETALQPKHARLRIVLYHVHLNPTRKIVERSRMPINHTLSIPSHGDLIHMPRLTALAPGSEAKIAVAAGIWTYAWDPAQAARFVAQYYSGPAEVPYVLKFAHVYTRFAITTYHQQGLNDPAKLTPERVARYIETLRPTGAILHFAFAPDWPAVRQNGL